ncbi:hypothetical protein A7D00_3145 [Trichophyton violaceum]|uniref:Uncharacterized protein n=1 Tax=Trichophyton violaceum TaxID=34388 RepID=A0A178FL14_TRIVO|nr:hypothetical protein A7D00_3145 [Trichophyton violaceum]
MAFVRMLGIIAGNLGTIPFGLDRFGGEGSHSGSTIKVAVALDGPQLSNSAGVFGTRLESSLVLLSTPEGQKQGTLVKSKSSMTIRGCIPYSRPTMMQCVLSGCRPPGQVATEATSTYAVTGDFSEPCGGAWFPSNLYISDKKDHQPDCFWIDKIGDQPNTGFQVRWPAYSEDQFDENNKDPKRLCNNVDFGLREGKRPQFNQLLSQEKTRRKSPGLSDSKHHSARRLCMSDSSFGPGFAHTEEGLFCDMDAKVLYAFCADIVEKSACFDLKRQRIVAREEATGVKATSTINGSARYSRIRDWCTNSTVA